MENSQTDRNCNETTKKYENVSNYKRIEHTINSFMNERKENIYWYELYYAFGKRQNFKFSDPVTS